MANLLVPEAEPVAGLAPTSPVLPASVYPLNLLLEMPRERSRWPAILSGSLALHGLIFVLAIQLPSFIPLSVPEHTVVLRRTPLYLPPDLLTQKAPNRQKLSKRIDLADLLASRPAPVRREAPPPSRRLAPHILAQAPKIDLTPAPTPPPPGSPVALSAPPQPVPAPQTPFQNIGSESATKAPPKIAVPKATVQSAIGELAHNPSSRRPTASDDTQAPPASGLSGSANQLAAHHATVELQSDPQGARLQALLGADSCDCSGQLAPRDSGKRPNGHAARPHGG